ncbi:hypothetical protein KA005_10840, partial [bacterium]|nr:hypothetical protein [bacterium]
PMPFESIRILDFFLLFPFLIGDVKLKQKDRKFRKFAENYNHLRPYARMPESSQLLERMRPFQVAAAKGLAGSNLLDADSWKEGIFATTDVSLPPQLEETITNANAEQSDLLDMLSEFANSYPLSGPDGLKARSSLLEFRYDTV